MKNQNERGVTKKTLYCALSSKWECSQESARSLIFSVILPNTVNTLLSNILKRWGFNQKYLLRKWHLHHVINNKTSQDYRQEQHDNKCYFQGESWLNLASMIQKALCCHRACICFRYTDNRAFPVLGFKETLSMYKGTKFDFHIYTLV